MTVTAVFDGQCVICRATERVVRVLDWRRKVRFLDLHDHERVAAVYPWLDQDEAMGQIHVVDGLGRVYAGFQGTRRMLRELPLGLPVWLLLKLPGMGAVGERVYRFIARRRYAVNRWFGAPVCEDDTCRI
jgi:predicted DCC family thiol-disulfide oxidoreductase YuxK